MGQMTKLHMGIATALRGSGGGGGGSTRAPIESPDSLRSIAYARILDLISEGEIVGFADQENPLSCVFLNETPVANADGSLNFKNIQIDSRVGTQTQDYLPNFEGVENEIAVGVELRNGNPWVRAISNLNLNAVRVRLSVPVLTQTDTTNGDIKGTAVEYMIQLQTDGGVYVSKFRGFFRGKTTSKYERTHYIELPPSTSGWSIRVTRITGNSDSTALQNQTVIESYAEIIEAKLRMPMSALVSVIVDAEQFNNIPSRAYRVKGRIVRVPSNYDPDTRTYTGVWDGTFQARYTNNPAWVFYDMATNARYGLGHLVSPELVNKWTLYRIAQYCDQLVADGFGGQEPRFTCNLVLQTQNDATRVMMDLAAAFRGIIYANGGAITAVCDMPEDPQYTYTPSNVVDGKFTYAGSNRKVRHTVALVSWNDLTDFGRAKIEYVQDDDGIARYGVQPTDVIALGCTSRSQARRLGRYILATERFETDTVVFAVGLDGTVVAPGKIINIADPLQAGVRRGGRIRGATLNSVEVDFMSVGVNAGDTLVVTLPTGDSERRTILNVDGNTITATANFSALPVAQSVWAIDSVGIPLERYRVVSVAERTDQTSRGYDISAIMHVPGKYAYADTGEPIEVAPVPEVPGPVVPSPTGLMITQREVTDQNTTRKIVNLTWTTVTVAVSYNVQWRQGDGSWIDLGVVGFNNIDIPNVNPGPFEVQVVAVNALGLRSVPTFGGPYDITPVVNPPGYVEDITTGLEVLEQIGLDNQQALAQEVIDRLQGDADVEASAAADLAAEAATRAANDLAVANAAAENLLNATASMTAALNTETTIRQNADESLAQQIATLSAGTGEQFDTGGGIWYFDTTAEGWTAISGSGVTVVDGWLRPDFSANATQNVQSPVLTLDSTSYRYVKFRLRKVGAPGTWRGWVRWITAADTTWDTIKQMAIPEPTFDANGIATVDFKDIPWPTGVTRMRIYPYAGLTSAGNYVEYDWIAIGRPSPGASAAALQVEQTARIAGDAAEAAQRTTLASQMRGNYTGTDIAALTSGLLYNERVARTTADSAMASDITSLQARVTTAEGNITSTSSAVSSLTTRVTAAEGTISSQGDSITSLTSRMTNAEGVNTAQATAITNLTTRVTSAEGNITTLTSNVTSLQSTVAGKADTTALNALTTRVTAAEGNITSQANSITSLTAMLAEPAKLLNPSFEVADNWTLQTNYNIQNNATEARTGARYLRKLADPADAGVVRQTFTDALIAVEGGRKLRFGGYIRAFAAVTASNYGFVIDFRDSAGTVISGGTATAYKPTPGAAHNWLLVEGTVDVPATAATCRLYVRTTGHVAGTLGWDDLILEALDTAAVAAATAITSLDARVTAAEGSITSQASQITSLSATVNASTQGQNIVAGQTLATDWVRAGTGTGELSPVSSANTTVMGGKLLQIGDNNGNDMAFIRFKDLIPYDPTKLYRVRVRGMIHSSSTGTPSWYAGLCAMDAAKANYITTAGAVTGTLASAHYVAVGKTNTALDATSEVVGYFKGQSSGARTGAGTIANPWTMPNSVAFIGAMAIGNYNGQTGITFIDKIIIEDADAIGDAASNATAITALEARVTSAEGSITSQASQITSLTASANAATASITRLDQVSASAAVGNAVRNPSFEDDMSGWVATNAATAYIVTSAANARTGSKLLRIDSSGTPGIATQDDFVPVKVGQQVRFSFYGGSYGTAPNSGSVGRINVRWYDANKAQLSSGGYVATPAALTAPVARWAFASGIMTVPAGAAYCKAVITGTHTSGSWGFDDVAVEVLSDGMANAYASSGLTIDVNGYITGYRATNDGTTGIMSIVADKFQIVSPGGGERTEYSNGNWRMYNSSGVLQVQMGINI